MIYKVEITYDDEVEASSEAQARDIAGQMACERLEAPVTVRVKRPKREPDKRQLDWTISQDGS